MKTMSLLALGAVLVLAFGFVSFASGGDVENGKKVYDQQKCKLCHSIEGVGNKKNPLDGVGGKIGAEDIKKWIVTPKEMKADSIMKAYPKLDENDLDDLVSYMLSLK